jgi:glycosyltransferase involved in cell wall biosynthesis
MLDDPCRIYDCSNSAERPSHRGGGGPVMNDVMRYLHENADLYYYEFVASPQEAQVIITNDVFPAAILGLGKPLVKRMCGPFWNVAYSTRNDVLNCAARQADKVIFISEYSRRQYFNDNGDGLKSHCVVTHWVDPTIYFDAGENKEPTFTLAACATNWNRPEKRLNDLILLGTTLPQVQFIIIGTVEQELPSNFVKMGYLDKPSEIAYILNTAHGFVNLSYRDPATKTVPQAISCGLPVLYADSGGVGEMVANPNHNGPDFGTPIMDSHYFSPETEVPPLNLDAMIFSYNMFRHSYDTIKIHLETFNRKLAFRKMLDGYFSAISSVLKD